VECPHHKLVLHPANPRPKPKQKQVEYADDSSTEDSIDSESDFSSDDDITGKVKAVHFDDEEPNQKPSKN
jgi:hypothetical protein